MPEYLSPGVFIEEVDSGPQPIEGVSTSTTGAVGVTVRGPTSGPPALVTSFLEFTRTFGSFLPPPTTAEYNQFATDPVEGGRWWTFPLAVKGFFDNGGQRMFVTRVVSKTATAASIDFAQGLVAIVTQDASATTTTIKLSHLIDIDTTSKLTFVNGATNAALNATPIAVTAYDPKASTVTLAAAVGQPVSTTRGDFVVIAAVVTANTTLDFSAAAKGDWGDDIQVMVKPIVGATYSMLFDAALADPTATANLIAPAAQSTVATTLLVPPGTTFSAAGRLIINGDEYDFTYVIATGTISVSHLVTNYPLNAVVRQLRRAVPGPGPNTTVQVWGAQALYPGAIIELDNGATKERSVVQAVAGNTVTFSPGIAFTYWEGEALRVIEAEVDTRYAPGGVVQTTEAFTGLRLHDDGSASYLITAVNKRSQLVTVALDASYVDDDVTKFPTSPGVQWIALGGGLDNNQALSVDDFQGTDGGPGLRTGIQALLDIDEISILMAPGMWSGTVQSALIQQCETLLDRFAILDSPRLDQPIGIEAVQQFRAPLDTKYAALYYPWLQVNDPSQQQTVVAPPSGHVAGIYARVDDTRGVWKAPANEVISSIVQLDQQISQREQDLLNPYPVNINVLRFFTDRGNRVWGARVVTSDPQWKYVNVRRLFIYLETSLKVGSQWAVFEPNDEPLWARVRASVSNFLTTTWRSGALQGATAAEAFFVKCDRTTMTQDDIDNGRLIILVGVAPVKPAEFVIFRIQQFTADSSSST